MTRVQQWERRTEWPLAAAAVVFLGAYAWPILQPSLSYGWQRACDLVTWATWALFAADYLARLTLAEHRRRYWVRHLPDLLVVALPVLRPLRLLRLISLLKVLNQRAAASLRGRVGIYVGGATLIILFCASLAALDAERHSDRANIHTFGDAIWWATATVTTVGYGDYYPVTTTGRFVAVGLMISGIALIGVVTASFATWLLDRVRDVERDSRADLHASIEDLRTEIAALRQN